MEIADIIQIVIAVITFLGIIVSLVISVITLNQNKKIIEESNRANIMLYIDFSPSLGIYFLVIKNFGKSVGKLLKIDMNPKLDWNKTKFKQELKPLTDSENIVLAPGQKVSSWFDFDDYPDKIFDVKIEYESLGKKYIEEYKIDLRYIKNIDWLTQYAMDDNSKDNRKVLYHINTAIRDLSDKFR